MKRRNTVVAFAIGALVASAAAAQPHRAQAGGLLDARAQLGARAPAARASDVRVVVGANGGWQAGERRFADAFRFERYAETAEVGVEYQVRPGLLYDGGVSVRLWRWLGIGLTVSAYTDRTDATVAGSIPHPFFFDRNRSIEGRAPAARQETSAHALATAFIPLGRRGLLLAGVGPAVVKVRQTFVQKVDYDESYPYDTATFRTADTADRTARKTGTSASVDLVVRVVGRLGAGAFVRYTDVEVVLKPGDDRSIATRASGWQAGAGVRFFF